MAVRYYSLQAGDINGALNVGADDGSWFSTAYSVSEPIGVVVGSWLGIALSPRRMLLVGVALFLCGSVLPLFVPDYGVFMLSRVVTGLAGGAIVPQSVVIQLRAWGPGRVPLALTLFLSCVTAAPQSGGLIGAWGVEHFGWSFVLWAAVPPGALAMVFGYIGLPREPIQWRPLAHADLAGLVAISAAVGLFVCAVSQGDRMRWLQTAAIPALFAASASCLAVFILRDWSGVRHPIFWAKLYRRWNLAISAVAILPLALAIGISGVIVPAALIQVQGFRPEQVSPTLWAALWPQAVSYMTCMIILTWKLIEVRAMIIAGVAIIVAGAFLDLSLTAEWQSGEFYIGQVLQGIGLPVMALPLVYMFLGDVRPPAESLPAASILNLSRVLAGPTASAWLTTSLRINSQKKLAEILSNTGLYQDGQGTSLATLTAHAAHSTSDSVLARTQAVQIVAGAARRQAAVLGSSETLVAVGWLLLASCLLVLLMVEFGGGRTRGPHSVSA